VDLCDGLLICVSTSQPVDSGDGFPTQLLLLCI